MLKVKYIELSKYVCTNLLLNRDQNSYKIVCVNKEPGQHLPHSFIQTSNYIFTLQPSELMLVHKLKVFRTKSPLPFYSIAHLVISTCSKTLNKPEMLLKGNEDKYISLVMNIFFI